MIDFDILFYSRVFLQIGLAAIIGTMIGFERELAGKDPGLRTFMFICAGSCIFAMISELPGKGMPNIDPTRISAQVVTGIGFLGAGAIFKSGGGVAGLTTAAMMWITSALGLTIGHGYPGISISALIVFILMLSAIKFLHKFARKYRISRKSSSSKKTHSLE